MVTAFMREVRHHPCQVLARAILMPIHGTHLRIVHNLNLLILCIYCIDDLMQIWAAMHPKEGSPFSSHKDLYEKIDSIQNGDAPWQSITIKHPNASLQNTHHVPEWQLQDFKVWFHDPKALISSILSNPDFKDGMDYAPCMIYDEEHERVRSNFMSADWAWNQCVSETTCL